MSRCLVVIDVQDWILDLAGGPLSRAELISAVARRVTQFRADGVPIIWVRFLRQDGSDGGPDGAARIADGCGFIAGDVVIDKFGVDAFAGTELDSVLQAMKLDELELAGFSTAHAIIETAVTGARLGYRISVLADACAAPTVQLHDAALDRLRRSGGVVVKQDAPLFRNDFLQK